MFRYKFFKKQEEYTSTALFCALKIVPIVYSSPYYLEFAWCYSEPILSVNNEQNIFPVPSGASDKNLLYFKLFEY